MLKQDNNKKITTIIVCDNIALLSEDINWHETQRVDATKFINIPARWTLMNSNMRDDQRIRIDRNDISGRA